MGATRSTYDAIAAELSNSIEASIAHLISTAESRFGPTNLPGHAEFTGQISQALAGGKRFRAVSAAIGTAVAAAAQNPTFEQTPLQLVEQSANSDVYVLGAALELYQGAALVHDDVIDRAATRRGRPAYHRALSDWYKERSWPGSPEHFGTSAAILAGDYLIAAAEMGLQGLGRAPAAAAVRERFAQMSGEVAFGQYLDLLGSSRPLYGDNGSVEDIFEVLRLKSARYSVAHPVALGAELGGAPPQLVSDLESIFEPAGIAFQLRDDHLGVFGSPGTTGKPTSGDLEERKRTVLLHLAHRAATKDDQGFLEEVYSRPVPPSGSDIARIRQIFAAFGVGEHEEEILRQENLAYARLVAAALPPAAEELARSLIGRLVHRET